MTKTIKIFKEKFTKSVKVLYAFRGKLDIFEKS
jgi:hypothetical protein